MKINGTNKKTEPIKYLYICNRKKCANCYDECHHTADISYALYKEHDRFEPGPEGTLWELKQKNGRRQRLWKKKNSTTQKPGN